MNKNLFHHINLTYGCTALRLVRWQERCQQKFPIAAITWRSSPDALRTKSSQETTNTPACSHQRCPESRRTYIDAFPERKNMTNNEIQSRHEERTKECSIRSTLSEGDAKSLLEQINASTQSLQQHQRMTKPKIQKTPPRTKRNR